MTARISFNNFLAVEGRKLALGGGNCLTAAEWLYLYAERRAEFRRAQAKVLDGFEVTIRNRHPELSIDTVAL